MKSFSSIIKAYDIRGKYGTELTEYHAYLLGVTFVISILKKESHHNNLFIGQDCRPSSNFLYESLKNGILNGVKLYQQSNNYDINHQIVLQELGVIHTPLLYFACGSQNSGIMVTASHNPKDFNGFKFVWCGLPFYGSQIDAMIKSSISYMQGTFIKQTTENHVGNSDNNNDYYIASKNNDVITLGKDETNLTESDITQSNLAQSFFDKISFIPNTLQEVEEKNKIKSQKYFDKSFVDKTSLYKKYISYLKLTLQNTGILSNNRDFLKKEKKFRILWNIANGSGYYPIEKIVKSSNLKDYIIEHKIVNNQKNNQDYDSLHVKELLQQDKYDLAISFDQDGDRLEIIDSNGQTLRGEIILVLLASYLYETNENKSDKIIVDIKTSRSIINYLENLGFCVIISRTGHVFIKKLMQKYHVALAGEESGHIYWLHYFTANNMREVCYYDDGIFTAMQILSIFINKPTFISDVLASLPKTHISAEIKIFIEEKKIRKKSSINSEKTSYLDQKKQNIAINNNNSINRNRLEQTVQNIRNNILNEYHIENDNHQKIFKLNEITILLIDGIRYEDSNLGWWLIRCSNTETCLIVKLEGYNKKAYNQIKKMVKNILSEQGYNCSNIE